MNIEQPPQAIPRRPVRPLARVLFLGTCFAAASAHAGLAIAEYTPAIQLSWTNSVSNAVYRIERAPTIHGPWTPLSQPGLIQASNTTVTLQPPAPGPQLMELFRVVWTDAAPAQPVGTWQYQGYDPGGELTVTGLLSVVTASPLTGSCTLAAAGAVPGRRHPIGAGVFSDASVSSPNQLRLRLPSGFVADNFWIWGQMTSDEFWGSWSYTDYVFSSSGRSWMITYTGRFMATRID